jgi:hypothetical protein
MPYVYRHDFRNKKISDLNAWQNKITSSSIIVNPKGTLTNDKEKNNVIFYQSEDVIGKKIYSLTKRSMIIEYYEYKEEANNEDPLGPLIPNI